MVAFLVLLLPLYLTLYLHLTLVLKKREATLSCSNSHDLK